MKTGFTATWKWRLGAAALAAATTATAAPSAPFATQCEAAQGTMQTGPVHTIMASTGSPSGTWIGLRENGTLKYHFLSYSTTQAPHVEMLNRLAELAYLNGIEVTVCFYGDEIQMIELQADTADASPARAGRGATGTGRTGTGTGQP